MNVFTARAAAFLAYFGAILFIGASASQNILHGWETGVARSETHALIFAAGSLAGALIQPIAWLAAFRAFNAGDCGRGIISVILASFCLLYATLSSLGFVATARSDMAGGREVKRESFALTKAKADAAIIELKTLAAAPISNRKVEAQRAERKQVLEATVADAQKALDGDSAPTASDPQSAALASYAASVGLEVDADKIAPWLVLATVVFFELGAGLSLVVAAVVSTASAQVSTKVSDLPTDPTPPASKRGRPRTAEADDVVQKIRDAGGEISGTLNQLGQQIGLRSKTAAHRTLRSLEASGHLRVVSSAVGTRVSVIN